MDLIAQLRDWRSVHLAKLHLLMEQAADEMERLHGELRHMTVQRNFVLRVSTLTDAERSAISDAADRYAEITPESARTAATLRGLLERLCFREAAYTGSVSEAPEAK